MDKPTNKQSTDAIELAHEAALAMDPKMTAAKEIVYGVWDNQGNAHNDVQFTHEMIKEEFARANKRREEAEAIGEVILNRVNS